jgi:hypothetical protein
MGCAAELALHPDACLAAVMRRNFHTALTFISLFTISAAAAAKPHVITFGKWMAVKWFVGAESRAIEIRARPLYVDTRLKEFTTGLPHDVTDRLFVVRRVFRLNDALPSENGTVPRWRWERGGWLLVDRLTGRVTQINLPEFDSFYSTASWYRDYVAYCGVSDDGKKSFAMVAQLGRRKPVLKKPLGEAEGGDLPDSECPAPAWERSPTRVTFQPDEQQKLTFSIRGHAVDIVIDVEDDEGAESR